MNLLQLSSTILLVTLLALSAKSQNKSREKIQASAEVLSEFGKMNENIPHRLFEVAEGMIIIPSMKNGGFLVAGERGKGIAIVKNANGTWSNPVFIRLTGGSIGFQAGVQAVDLVLIFKNRETLKRIGKGSFTLGGDVSVTAGPVGRSSTAGTDYKLEAEVYSYSKSKGFFAGISISGSSLHVDQKANKSYYGNSSDAGILFGSADTDSSQQTMSLRQSLNELTHP